MAVPLRSDWSLHPDEVAAMRAVDAAMRDLDIDYALVGAAARDLVLTGIHGIPQGVATKDVDFGLAVAGWDQFDHVKTQLIKTGRFESVDKVPHELRFHGQGGMTVPVDLVPFRGVEEPAKAVKWPPGDRWVMNVAGYEEALRSVLKVQVAPDLVIPAVNVVSLAMLKLFAWGDRREENNGKDARDFALVMKHYLATQDPGRPYADALPHFESVGYDRDRLAPRLLGSDTHALASAITRDALDALS